MKNNEHSPAKVHRAFKVIVFLNRGLVAFILLDTIESASSFDLDALILPSNLLIVFLAAALAILESLLLLTRNKAFRYLGFQFIPFLTFLVLLEMWSIRSFGDLFLIPAIEDFIADSSANDVSISVPDFDTYEQDLIIERSEIFGDLEEPVVEAPVVVEDPESISLPFVIGMWLALAAMQIWRTIFLEKTHRALQWRGDLLHPLTVLDLKTKKERLFVSQNLSEKAETHRLRAAFLLVLIVGLIGLGVQLYLTAGTLISRDVGNDPLRETQNLISQLTRELRTTQSLIDADQNRRREVFQVFRDAGNPDLNAPIMAEKLDFGEEGCVIDSELTLRLPIAKELPDSDLEHLRENRVNYCQDIVFFLNLEKTDQALTQRISSNLARRESIEASLSGIRTYISENLKALIENKPDSEEIVQQLVASGITRFGVLFVVIYLVQILVAVYRFSMRQAEFYEARANAILLTDPNEAELGSWRDDLFGAHIDFGKPPRDPSEYVRSAFETFFSRHQRKKDGE